MSNVVSKNLYELLGNDSDQDSDREPDPPTKVADKPPGRKGKRDAPAAAPAPTESQASGGERGGRGGRRGGYSANEDAFRDRNAGSGSNRTKPTDDGLREDRHRDRVGGGRRGNYDGRGRGRGGRGGYRGDRQDRSGQDDHQKQSELSWGAQTGDAEWTDEKAGEAIAKAEENEGGWDSSAAPPLDGDGEKLPEGGSGLASTEQAEAKEPEPEDNSKSYADYLAEQATKKDRELGVLDPRKPNEGSKQDKKWAKATELKRSEEEEIAFIKGKEEKAKRERQRKTKQFVETNDEWQEGRGRGDGRGRGRGDRGDRGDRGGGRGDRGDRGGRGGDRGSRGGRGRGEGFRGSRGGRGGGEGGFRGGRGSSELNVTSDENFPSLGSK